MSEGLIIGGIFLGCLARALFPFFKKRAKSAEEGQKIKWDNRYIWTIIFALIVSIVTAIMMFPSFDVPSTGVFSTAALYGWAAQDIFNRIAK